MKLATIRSAAGRTFRTIAFELGRTLLKLAVDRALRKELPAIFGHLDIEVPFLLINGAQSLTVQTAVTDVIEERIGRVPTATQVSAVLSLYDPVKAAIRNLKR